MVHNAGKWELGTIIACATWQSFDSSTMLGQCWPWTRHQFTIKCVLRAEWVITCWLTVWCRHEAQLVAVRATLGAERRIHVCRVVPPHHQVHQLKKGIQNNLFVIFCRVISLWKMGVMQGWEKSACNLQILQIYSFANITNQNFLEHSSMYQDVRKIVE